mmetsp:Transcript_72317/g.187673  ORF Transcript_72317/g.187673 Transcript_72317/m.187673 type:complete len:236 (-) Transcript_72317:63-770(-)
MDGGRTYGVGTFPVGMCIESLPEALCEKEDAGHETGSQAPASLGSRAVASKPSKFAGSIAQDDSAAAAMTAAKVSGGTLTKTKTVGVPGPAPCKHETRSRTRHLSEESINTPSSRRKPKGIIASLAISPCNWRSKYSFKVLARDPTAFSVNKWPFKRSVTSWGGQMKASEQAKALNEPRVHKLSSCSISSSTTFTRSHLNALAKNSSNGAPSTRHSSKCTTCRTSRRDCKKSDKG